jgi:hypothetical protein
MDGWMNAGRVYDVRCIAAYPGANEAREVRRSSCTAQTGPLMLAGTQGGGQGGEKGKARKEKERGEWKGEKSGAREASRCTKPQCTRSHEGMREKETETHFMRPVSWIWSALEEELQAAARRRVRENERRGTQCMRGRYYRNRTVWSRSERREGRDYAGARRPSNARRKTCTTHADPAFECAFP